MGSRRPIACPPTSADMRLIAEACTLFQHHLQRAEKGQQDWMRPFLDGTLDQALTNVRGAVKRDREATAALCR